MIYRNEDELIKEQGRRLCNVMERYKMIPSDMYKTRHIHKSTLSQYIHGTRKITREAASDLKRYFFPEVLIGYLLGEDEPMTLADAFEESSKYRTLVETGLIYLLRASGYTVNINCPEDGDAENAIDAVKHFCTLSKDGNTATLSVFEFHDLSLLIQNHADFFVKYKFS